MLKMVNAIQLSLFAAMRSPLADFPVVESAESSYIGAIMIVAVTVITALFVLADFPQYGRSLLFAKKRFC